MTLIFAVGGSLKLTDEAGVSYTTKLRDLSIDGGQPTEIDITTTADSIRKSYLSTAEPDRLTAEVLLEDTGSGKAAYEQMREYMGTAEDLKIHLILKNDAATPADHLVYDDGAASGGTATIGHIVDVQETSSREEASALSLVIKIKR